MLICQSSDQNLSHASLSNLKEEPVQSHTVQTGVRVIRRAGPAQPHHRRNLMMRPALIPTKRTYKHGATPADDSDAAGGRLRTFSPEPSRAGRGGNLLMKCLRVRVYGKRPSQMKIEKSGQKCPRQQHRRPPG